MGSFKARRRDSASVVSPTAASSGDGAILGFFDSAYLHFIWSAAAQRVGSSVLDAEPRSDHASVCRCRCSRTSHLRFTGTTPSVRWRAAGSKAMERRPRGRWSREELLRPGLAVFSSGIPQTGWWACPGRLESEGTCRNLLRTRTFVASANWRLEQRDCDARKPTSEQWQRRKRTGWR